MKPAKVIILDNNELSLMCYAQEYPANWARLCVAIDKKNEVKEK